MVQYCPVVCNQLFRTSKLVKLLVSAVDADDEVVSITEVTPGEKHSLCLGRL